MQHGFEQTAAFILRGCELGVQLVTQRHQFIDLGDDAVLFSEGWDGNWHRCYRFCIEMCQRYSYRTFFNMDGSQRVQVKAKKLRD